MCYWQYDGDLMSNYWLWVARKGSNCVDMRSGKILNWEGCDYDTENGDLALIYRPKPFQRIQYLVKVRSDSKLNPNPDDLYNCDFEVLFDFKDNGLNFRSMQNNPGLVGWYPLKVMFMTMKFPVEKKYWCRLKELIINENPDSTIFF